MVGDNILKYLTLIDGDNRLQAMNLHNFFSDHCSQAKGSSNNHQNWDGGYFHHVEEILFYCTKLYAMLSEKRPLPFTLSDAILILFLHDIEKPIKYSSLKDSFNLSDGGIKEALIKKFDIRLTEDQKDALKYIHGEPDNEYSKFKKLMNPLGAFCHCCDVISARIFFDYPKKHTLRIPKMGNVFIDKKRGSLKFVVRLAVHIEEITANPEDFDFVCETAHEDGDFSYICMSNWCKCMS